DGALVLAPGAVHAQQGDPPLVRARGVEIDVVLVPRQTLAVSLQRHLPRPGLPQLPFQLRPYSRERGAAHPAVASRSALDPISPEETDLRLPTPSHIAEARDVRPGRPPAVDVLVREARHRTAGARLGDVVHQVMAHFPARIGESCGEAGRSGAQENLRGTEGRGAEKDQ